MHVLTCIKNETLAHRYQSSEPLLSTLKTAIALSATTLLITACSSGNDSSKNDTQVQSDRIFLQAESWTENSSTATLNWLPIQLDNDFGQAAKLVAQDSGQWSDSGLPTLTYDINFLEAGTYLLNVHGRHDSTYAVQPEQHTILTFGSDNGNVELPVNGFDDQWQWINTDIYGQALTIEVVTPGDHLFKIASVSTGLILDQIRIDKVVSVVTETNNDATDPTSLTNQTTANQTTTSENNSAPDNNQTQPQATNENTAPSVTINGPLQGSAGQPLTFQANATDDGNPDGKVYYYWTKISGPADVSISNLQSATTEVTFSTPGIYTMQVSANDGQRYSNAAISITVATQTTSPEPTPAGNTAPIINVIAPVSAVSGNAVSISGSATDDGLPNGGVYYYWSKLAGPGNVSFSTLNTATTQATFSTAGTYQLQINASDGELYTNREVTVNVSAGETTQAINTTHSSHLGTNWKTQNTRGKVTARHEAGGVAVNGKLYVIGGRGDRPVDMYDPQTNEWKTVANAPMELHHFQPVAIGTKIYVIGAFTCCYPVEKIVSNIYVFNTRTNRWTKGSKIPANRQRGGAGAAVHQGKIYLLGGNTNGHSGGAVGWFDEFDPATGNWKRLATAPDARDHATIAIADNKLVVAGGRESDYPNTFQKTVSRTNVYDFNTGKWTTEANIPTARAGTMTVAHGAEVLVIGGESMASAFAHNNVEAYNVHSKKWRKLQSLNTGRHGGAASFVDGDLHVVTGSDRRAARGETTSHEVLR